MLIREIDLSFFIFTLYFDIWKVLAPYNKPGYVFFFFLFLWLGTFPRVLRPSLLKRAIRMDKNTLVFHFGLLATSSLVQKGKGGNTEH